MSNLSIGLSIGASINPSITLIQSTAPPQHVIGDKWEGLTQRQKQRLGSRHVQRTGVAREELAFQDTRLVRAHRFAKRFGDSSLQTGVILDGNQMRVILAEPWQHASVYVSVKVIHQERAEDGDIVLVRELVEQILEIHAGGYVASLPKNIHHLAPPAHLRVTPIPASFRDYVCRQA